MIRGNGAIVRVLQGFASALRAHEVWLLLGVQDVRNRYKRSIVGPLWIVMSTALMVVGLGLLFGGVFAQDVSRFVAYLAIGMVSWGLISSSITDGGYAFIAAETYIKQIPFPKQVYLLRTMVVNLIVFLFGMPVLIGAALYYRLPVSWGTLWVVPGLALVIVCCLGHVTVMAYLSVFFRDLPYAVASALQLVYFFTPIIYPVELLQQRGLAALLFLNPFYYLIELVRFPMLEASAPPTTVIAGGLVYTSLVWSVALAIAAAHDRKVAYSL